ncbi:hypothetical protein BKA70DRAFT_1423104 [Coprinopsis sp. MPI-PUGE-AT-0042]|nr:hypothetical protein BKA70DRAFT_1423104 [Coprinopsis sp. MPI-PUGE-AT-0042]
MSSRVKRQRLIDDPSAGGIHNFPAALLAIPESSGTSPTKVVKKLSVARPRNPRPRGKQTAQAMTKAGGKESLIDEHDSYGESLPIGVPSNMEGHATPSPSAITDDDLAAFTPMQSMPTPLVFIILSRISLWYRDIVLRNDYHLNLAVDDLCIHRHFFLKYEIQELVGQEHRHSELTAAIAFLRRSLSENEGLMTYFSAKSFSSAHLTGWTIVTHSGISLHAGTWRCLKDSGLLTCPHIKAAQKRYCQVFEDDEHLSALGDVEAPSEGCSVEDLGRHKSSPVSHLPILPPSWATLQSDPRLYTRPFPYRKPLLQPFGLQPTSSCPCPSGRTYWDPSRPYTIHWCDVFTLDGAHRHQIKLQPCRTCPPARRRFIGPDLREEGLFNLNNSILVSHELLDECTSAYTTSETPFSAWVAHLSRRYSSSGHTFMGEDLFRSVWFGYAGLQAFDNDFSCQRCGPHPDSLICDGITLAFGRKHLRESLHPPTKTSDTSTIRNKVKYMPKQQLLDSSLRKQLRMVMKAPSLDKHWNRDEGSESDDSDNSNRSTQPLPPSRMTSEQHHRHTALIREHLDRISVVQSALREHCPELADLFVEHFGAAAYSARKLVPTAIRNLYAQIAAEESVLQLINRASLNALQKFLDDPQPSNVALTLSIPAVYEALSTVEVLDPWVPILKWLELRASSTLNSLMVENPLLEAEEGLGIVQDDWKKTGCLYSMPQIRERPRYPRLKGDQQQDKSSKCGDRCGKYFLQYGQKRLTGGIMVIWCTHSIAYGFHCIASSEGRDDVFSAIATRWPKAPKRIIYDFSCALGPYCMLREPDFFADTFFAIDHFHSTGHTKCSAAAFLSEYANVDPRLARINSSAAECGNGALSRIRKSVSYMSQERAIIFTKTFLSIWNRVRIKRMH